MTQYHRGRRIEYDYAKRLALQGYAVIRAAGSHSPFDLVAWKNNTVPILFIQCKYTKSKTNKFKKTIREIEKVFVSWPAVQKELCVKRKFSREYEVYRIFNIN